MTQYLKRQSFRSSLVLGSFVSLTWATYGTLAFFFLSSLSRFFSIAGSLLPIGVEPTREFRARRTRHTKIISLSFVLATFLSVSLPFCLERISRHILLSFTSSRLKKKIFSPSLCWCCGCGRLRKCESVTQLVALPSLRATECQGRGKEAGFFSTPAKWKIIPDAGMEGEQDWERRSERKDTWEKYWNGLWIRDYLQCWSFSLIHFLEKKVMKILTTLNQPNMPPRLVLTKNSLMGSEDVGKLIFAISFTPLDRTFPPFRRNVSWRNLLWTWRSTQKATSQALFSRIRIKNSYGRIVNLSSDE